MYWQSPSSILNIERKDTSSYFNVKFLNLGANIGSQTFQRGKTKANTSHISVQFSHSVLSESLWPAAQETSLSFTNSWTLIKLMSIESVMPFNHRILCHPLFFLPSIFPSIRVFSNESVLCIRWPNYWSFSISPSNDYSGLISFRIGCFDLLAIQGTLKSLLQYHSSKASVL